MKVVVKVNVVSIMNPVLVLERVLAEKIRNGSSDYKGVGGEPIFSEFRIGISETYSIIFFPTVKGLLQLKDTTISFLILKSKIF